MNITASVAYPANSSRAIHWLPAVGRALIALPFLMSGLGKLANFAGTVGFIQSVGLPLASVGAVVALLTETVGGTLLLIGFQARLVALVLAIFTFAAAIFFHNNFADQNQAINFLKNIMIIGGLLQIVYFGAGAFSVDRARTSGK